jgi:signal recognition particle receptor subunit beta
MNTMSLQNKAKPKMEPRVLQYKIVYWGPGESGKTTSYTKLIQKYKGEKITNGFSIATTDDRTLWADCAFLSFNTELFGIQHQIIVQIATCTGQERFLSTREFVIGGADGVIFVADSNPTKMDENIRSFKELLAFIGKKDIPLLVQLNKRDIPYAIPIEEFKQKMGLPEEEVDEDNHLIVYPCIATKGTDVYPVFHDLMEKILLRRMLNGL